MWWTTSSLRVLKLCFLSYNDTVRYILPALGEAYQGNSGLSKLPLLSFSPFLPPSALLLLVSWRRAPDVQGDLDRKGRGWDRNSPPPSPMTDFIVQDLFRQAFRHIHSNNYAQQQWSPSSRQGPIVYMPLRVSVCACIWRQSKAKNILLEIRCWYLAGLFTRGLGEARGYCSHPVNGENEINEKLRVTTNSEAPVWQHPSFFCCVSLSLCLRNTQKQIIKFDWHTGTLRWRGLTMAQNYSTYCNAMTNTCPPHTACRHVC